MEFNNNKDNYAPKARQDGLVMQELPDEVLIYDLNRNKAFCLNKTAAFVWQRADGKTPVTQIAQLLKRELRTPVDEAVIWLALEQLGKDGLIEDEVAAPLVFSGMNRRDLIATLGKSAAVTLPLVMMITAPHATSAQSANLDDGADCESDSQCISGSCGNDNANNESRCCRPENQVCSTTSQCCLGLVCSSGSCQDPSDGG